MRRALLLSLVAAAVFAQTRPSVVFLASDAPRMIAGQTQTLLATALDQNSATIANAAYTWASTNSTVLRVNASGTVEAVGLGIADITATYLGVRGTLRLQVLPKAIEITPANPELTVGEAIRMSARALNAQNEEIANVTLQWQVLGEDGFTNNGASMRVGELYGGGAGKYTVRAFFAYGSTGSGQFLTQASGQTIATVRPAKTYRSTRLLSSGDTREYFQARAVRTTASVNDKGQAVFLASLDGYNTGILLTDSGQTTLLTALGTPGPNPGSVLSDFDDPVINAAGDAAFRGSFVNGAGALMLATKTEVRPLVFESSADSGFEQFTGIGLSPTPWNGTNEVAFVANFRRADETGLSPGLFRYRIGAGIQLEVDQSMTFPGLRAPVTFDRTYGFDDSGNLVFQAADTTGARGIYRKNPDGSIAKLAAPGDLLGGVAIRTVNHFVTGKGNRIGFIAQRTDNITLAAVVTGGNLGAARTATLSGWRSFLGLNVRGDALLSINGGQGWGVYTWTTGVPTPVLIEGRPSPTGDLYLSFQTAAIADDGTVIAQARLASNPFVLVRIGTSRSVLFESGSPVRGTAGTMLTSFVPEGKQSASALVQAGGSRRGVLAAGEDQVSMLLAPGDRPAGSAVYLGESTVRRTTAGDLLTLSDQSLVAIGRDGGRILSSYPMNIPAGRINTPWSYASNLSGSSVTVHSGISNVGQTICYSTPGQPLQAIAYLGSTNPQYRTASPAGGFFDGLNDFVIDESGRVWATIRVNGGPLGLFLWSDGRWNSVLVVDQTRIEDQAVRSINTIRSSGTRAVAWVTLQTNTQLLLDIADPSSFRVVLRSTDGSPYGSVLGNFSGIDANARGEIAFFTQSGAGGVFVVNAAGEVRLVYSRTARTDSGEYLRTIYSVDIRDDGSVFFIGMNFQDQLVLYAARKIQ